MSSATPGPNRSLAPATVRAYAGDWGLFADWCTSTDTPGQPADPAAVVAFLADCPAAPSTQRRRVAAIDHHHAAAGLPKPGESDPVRRVLGRPTGDIPEPSPEGVAAVQTALRNLPSHGWTQGMFGRRDRCLLVLSQLAGVPYKHLAHMVVSSVQVADGAAFLATAAGATTLTAVDNPVLCGPCAVVRWQRVLNVATARITTKSVAQELKKAKEVTPQSVHLCRSTRHPAQTAGEVWLFPPIDQWGALPFPVQRLTPHSLSRRVRDPLAGDYGTHRSIDVDPVEKPAPPAAPGTAASPQAAYSRTDWERAWARRRDDIQRMDGIGDELAELDRRADELNRRAEMLLANE